MAFGKLKKTEKKSQFLKGYKGGWMDLKHNKNVCSNYKNLFHNKVRSEPLGSISQS